jgi:hypothetical protein
MRPAQGQVVGLTGRMVGAWPDMAGSMRAVLDARPSESTLLAFAMLSGLFFFLGRLAELWLGPEIREMGHDAVVGQVGAEFAVAMIGRPLMLYGVAAALCGVARLFGGRGGLYDSRAALFWAALVSAPPLLMSTVLAAGLGPVAPAVVVAVVGSLGGFAFAWALAHCLAVAHGFRGPWAILGVMFGLTAAIIAVGRLLQ